MLDDGTGIPQRDSLFPLARKALDFDSDDDRERDERDAAVEELDRAEDALRNWSECYPEDVFIPVSDDQLKALGALLRSAERSRAAARTDTRPTRSTRIGDGTSWSACAGRWASERPSGNPARRPQGERMTALRLIDGGYPSNDGHSRRADLTDDHLADLHHITRNILAPAQQACRELADGIASGDRHLVIAAQRRLLAAALEGREQANRLEREAWLWPTRP